MRKDYYSILGLPKGASAADIKRAYREKAKKYHPDRNKHPRAAEAFVLINEAYEMLSNPVVSKAIEETENAERRKKYYGTSKAGGQAFDERREAARARAEKNAERSYEQFTKTPIYKTAMVVSSLLDFFAVFFSILLIVFPFVAFKTLDPEQQKENYGMFVLTIIGLILFLGYWKYVIKGERDS